MRISDWSSDVCSSDLDCRHQVDILAGTGNQNGIRIADIQPSHTINSAAVHINRRAIHVNTQIRGAASDIDVIAGGSDNAVFTYDRSALDVDILSSIQIYISTLYEAAYIVDIRRIDGNDKIGRASCRERVCQYL